MVRANHGSLYPGQGVVCLLSIYVTNVTVGYF